jgi:single-stranded DNA-binding protein
VNTITLTGRLTKSIRSNSLDGTPVVNFTLAAETGLVGKLVDIQGDGRQQLVYVPATAYFDCAAWDKDAAAAGTLEKGQEVTVDIVTLGAKSHDYEGKTYSNIVARITNVRPGAKARAAGAEQAVPAGYRGGGSGFEDESEIPF